MSVTGIPDDDIPHGLRGYRKPYHCRCDVCKAANAAEARRVRANRRNAENSDELSRKRAARRTVTADTVSNVVGPMEKAVIAECEGLERAKIRPTLVVAARNLAKIVDTPKMSSIHTSTTKQIMAILADLHGDSAKAKSTGRRKSGGRLATVGNLTKVKRAQ